ncbi:hypothetical protein EXIGLDRAFT_719372 [Exidia glandulosa HHB12029]|uniref:MYND-type domain-containing protein n=1 Tax=Exidia glandulosa HHB12029 TaxID=1314781 RepID=A0A165H421_EXIGL|nr:hypothetical protein EXIGLDRAFT_719372 [Exidia glandulosa HHB12029]
MDFRVGNHELYNACIKRLIALPRTADTILDLANTLLANLCAPHRRSSDARRCFETYIDVSCHLVTAALMSGTDDQPSIMDRVQAYSRFQKKKAKAWPVDPQQLIPGGAHATVEALVFWICSMRSYHGPIGLYSLLLAAHRPMIFPETMKPRIRNDLIWAVVQMLGVPPSTAQIPATWPTRPSSTSRSTRGLQEDYEMAVQVLATINNGPHSGPDDISLFINDYEDVLWAGAQLALRRINCTRGSCLCSRPKADGCLLDMLTRVVRVLMVHFGLTSASPGIDVRVAQAITAETDSMPSNWGATHILYWFLAMVDEKTQRCFDDACRTYKVDAPLQRCARYFLVRYCGRDCQRKDWRGAGSNSIAHKEVCPLIGRLVPEHHLPPLYKDWEPTYLRDPMRVRELHLLYRWACESAVLHSTYRITLEHELMTLVTEDPETVILPRPAPFIRFMNMADFRASVGWSAGA